MWKGNDIVKGIGTEYGIYVDGAKRTKVTTVNEQLSVLSTNRRAPTFSARNFHILWQIFCHKFMHGMECKMLYWHWRCQPFVFAICELPYGSTEDSVIERASSPKGRRDDEAGVNEDLTQDIFRCRIHLPHPVLFENGLPSVIAGQTFRLSLL